MSSVRMNRSEETITSYRKFSIGQDTGMEGPENLGINIGSCDE